MCELPAFWLSELVERSGLFGVSAEDATVAIATLAGAVDRLSARERSAFEAHYLRGMSAGEIAGRDRVSEASVRSAIRRARIKVRAAFGIC